MYRVSLYALLFVVVMLLQIFIFDRLTLSVFVAPLIYVTFLVVLPIQTSQLEMIFWSLILGVVADFCMGMAGVNTIATLFVGYVRVYIMGGIFGKDLIALGGVPSISKVGALRYFNYLALMVLILSFIFFVFESLNPQMWLFTLQRFAISGFVSLAFVWLLSYIFGSLLTRRL